MQRVNCILNDPEFLKYLKKNQEAETDRKYCRHDMTHFLDVARISCILTLEEKLDIKKEILYAAGLLHDIGRWMEYESGIDHAAASKELAAGILQNCGFLEVEIAEILTAIEGHREKKHASSLEDILFRADKFSRNCTLCDARATCKKFQNGEVAFLSY